MRNDREAHAELERCVACQVGQGRNCRCRDTAESSMLGLTIWRAVIWLLVIWLLIASVGIAVGVL